MNSKSFFSHRYCYYSIGFLIVFSFYLPSINFDILMWDDEMYLTNNESIKLLNLDALRSFFFEFHFGLWAPFTWMSHALDYAIWGIEPFGHRFPNLLIHSLSSIILLSIILDFYRKFFNERDTQLPSLHIIAIGSAFFIFALHPLRAESVVWISQRKDILCTFFYLLSIKIYFFHYIKSKSPKKKILLYILSLFLFFVAMSSKATAMTLPLTLLIIENKVFNNKSSFKRILKLIPYFIVSLAIVGANYIAHYNSNNVTKIQGITIEQKTVLCLSSLKKYILNIFFPQNISPYYIYTEERFWTPVLSSIILVVTLICIGFYLKNKLIKYSSIILILSLIPYINLINFGNTGFVTDRYTYIPSIWASLILFALFIEILNRLRGSISIKCAIFSICAYTIFIVFMLSRQLPIWENDYTLWSRVIRIYPNVIELPYRNRGTWQLIKGHYKGAAEDFTAAINIQPQGDLVYGRALAHANLGNYNSALADIDMHLNFIPDDPLMLKLKQRVIAKKRGLNLLHE